MTSNNLQYNKTYKVHKVDLSQWNWR